ncbi:foldase [Lactococcus garvieae]|uniref:foldase n=1 Tax=Lactococcus garvieae TaxID=1363 RepID=UPI0005B33F27|nr:foldase [Lactococcus garvieae]
MKSVRTKIILAALVASMGVYTLTGCSNSAKSTSIISMKEGTIDVYNLYEKAKELQGIPTSTLLQDLTFSKILEKDYGTKITDKEVKNQVDTVKKQMGDQFSSVLQQYGYTEEGFKFLSRLQLLTTYAIDQEISKTQYTESNLKTAWESYHPEVEAVIVSVATKEEAVQASKSDADKFEKDNKDKKIKFDSTNTSISSELKTAAFKLKNGQLSKAIEVQNPANGMISYYVIKMINNPKKGTDINKYKNQLKTAIKNEKEADADYTNKVKAQYIKNHNVEIKEKEFSTLFSQLSTDSSK